MRNCLMLLLDESGMINIVNKIQCTFGVSGLDMYRNHPDVYKYTWHERCNRPLDTAKTLTRNNNHIIVIVLSNIKAAKLRLIEEKPPGIGALNLPCRWVRKVPLKQIKHDSQRFCGVYMSLPLTK